MNIFKWLKNKTGKLPISLAQAAGITAVVGAAGFGAMSFLSSPADTNNTFLPPTANQGQVVYVSQNGGGGQYEANGEVGSSFKATPSRAIKLANQEAARQAQTRALEESAGQQTYQRPGDEVNPQLPKAYQLSNTDLGLGMGAGADKQLNSSLETFSNIQNQLAGVTQAVNNAQAQAGQGAKPGAAPQGSTSGQTAAQLASAPRNWGNSGLTRAGGGNSGSSNAFTVQDSGKNARAQDAAAVAQAGNAVAQAQAAMAQMQEGSRLQARANFGSSEGLGKDKDAALQRSRRFTGKGKDELAFIRKQTAEINANKTNAANEGGNPFLASAKISGGLTVEGDSVTTGQGSSSGDLKGNFARQMSGINAKLGQVQTNMDEQEAERDDLKSWMWSLFTTGLIAISAIAVLVLAAKVANFIWGPILYALAGILTAATLVYIWAGAIKHITSYNGTCGSDGWTTFGWVLSGIMTAGVGLAWTNLPGKLIGDKIPKLITGGLAVVGLGSVGMGLADILKKGEDVESLAENEKYQQGDEK